MPTDLFIAGDIGATKTHLAVFSRKKGPRNSLAEAKFPSAKFENLEMIVEEFLAQNKIRASSAVFAVAGPVIQDKAKITNLPWLVKRDTLKRQFKFQSVILLNDLAAIAASVPILTPADIKTIKKGKACTGGSIAVIAPGTGLGIAYLTWDGTKYAPHSSEGGHSGFAPADRLQSGLLRYLLPKLGKVSCENVCSGRGILRIYEYLKAMNYAEDSHELSSEMEAAEDPAPVITQAALRGGKRAALSSATIETFVSILGVISANAALSFLSTGGVYLAGGIPKIILHFLKNPSFVKSFIGVGVMSDLLSQMPVKVIVHPNAALLGAAHILLRA
jgi:glucokinase